jgi:hypothetical protein
MSDCPVTLASDTVLIETDLIETVLIETEELFDVLEITGLGPRGNNGDSIRKNPTFTYDAEDQLVRVDYPDGSFKLFAYTEDGDLDTITYQLGAAEGIRTFVFTDGKLTAIQDT